MNKPIFQKGDILALDFDGVIANSLEECLVVGFNAFSQYNQENRKILRMSELDTQVVDESRRIRKYIRTGEDYVFIFLALHQELMIHNQNDFDRFKEKNNALKPVFHDLFYQHRERFSRELPDQWIQLSPLYPNMTEYLKSFKIVDHLYIITTKQIEYVHLILKAHHIQLKEENCFHAHPKRSKKEIIGQILKDRTFSASQFHFIDDQVDTLMKVSSLGIQCYLAAWGYNDKSQADLAVRNQIHVLQLDEFLSRF
jgi:phosphoglycolate phosphatase-like HAD superfamily hydrolase